MKLTNKILKKMIVSEIKKLTESMPESDYMELDHGETLHQAVKDAGYEPGLDSISVDKKALMDALLAKGLSSEQAQDVINTVESMSDIRDHGTYVEYV